MYVGTRTSSRDGSLSAGVAREINNPISFVNSNLGALQRHVEDMLQALSICKKHDGEDGTGTHAAKDGQDRKIDIAYIRKDVASLLSESQEGLMRVSRIVRDLKEFSRMGSSEQ